MLHKGLLPHSSDTTATPSSENGKLTNDTNRLRRRKKRFRSRSRFGYYSDGTDECRSESAYVRTLSDVFLMPSSSTTTD
ncbi:hypothetical protein V3C99_001499 [Haemonchus contortus]